MDKDDRIARANTTMWLTMAKRWDAIARAVRNAGGSLDLPASEAVRIARDSDSTLRQVSKRTLERDWEAMHLLAEMFEPDDFEVSPRKN